MFASFFLKMLNKEAASARSRPDDILDRLHIREGQSIADIGSGGGYFTLVFARMTGESGRVYAVDVKKKYLDFIRRRAERKGLGNISFVLAGEGGMDLPEAGLDLIFARNVFHHLPEQSNYFSGSKNISSRVEQSLSSSTKRRASALSRSSVIIRLRKASCRRWERQVTSPLRPSIFSRTRLLISSQ
jgi:SAM-dependent methyltransferase